MTKRKTPEKRPALEITYVCHTFAQAQEAYGSAREHPEWRHTLVIAPNHVEDVSATDAWEGLRMDDAYTEDSRVLQAVRAHMGQYKCRGQVTFAEWMGELRRLLGLTP